MNEERESPKENQQEIQPYEPDPHVVYSIDVTARIVDIPRHTILLYCRYGLISPARSPDVDGYWFDAGAIWRLRQIEYLRTEYEVNIAGIRRIVELTNEVNRLRAEVRFLRH